MSLPSLTSQQSIKSPGSTGIEIPWTDPHRRASITNNMAGNIVARIDRFGLCTHPPYLVACEPDLIALVCPKWQTCTHAIEIQWARESDSATPSLLNPDSHGKWLMIGQSLHDRGFEVDTKVPENKRDHRHAGSLHNASRHASGPLPRVLFCLPFNANQGGQLLIDER